MNLKQDLDNALAANKAFTARIAELEAQITATPKTEDAIASATTALNAELVNVRGELTTANSEVARLKAELKTAQESIDAKVSARALEIAQTQGNVLPVSFRAKENPANSGKSSDALWAEYHALPTEKRNSFYKKNRAEMRSN